MKATTYNVQWTNDDGEVRSYSNQSGDDMVFLTGVAIRMGYYPVVSEQQ